MRLKIFVVMCAATFLMAATPTPRLVLTSKYNGLANMSEFSCSDTVHGYITLPEKNTGQHTLEGIWIMPDGEEKAHSRDRVDFGPLGRRNAYIWLSFQDKSGGSLGDLRASARANSNDQFSGEWHVKVLWDEKLLMESKFNVRCS